MFQQMLDWFLRDPLQNFLVVFGGSGLLAGVFKWGAMWSDRRRVQVRILAEHFDPTPDRSTTVTLRFEITNVGDKTTSLRNTVVVRALTPKAKPSSLELTVAESDRQLPPHSQKQFTAVGQAPPSYVFCWYKRYLFRPLRGSSAVIRYRNAKNIDISFVQYWREYMLFRLFGKVTNAA